MDTLKFEKLRIPGADMGEENAIPDLKNGNLVKGGVVVSDRISAEEKAFLGKGLISSMMPYTMQDGYNRDIGIKEFDGAVLENEYIKAVFIPALGGRLWSLYHKKEQRELLYENDVFRPANLALRNAWFSGGVEWNVGMRGHTPFTCAPLFTQKFKNKNGESVLRMYEYERIRGVVYRVEATLKRDVLYVHVKIENTSDKDKYMYWWSNIAVLETEDTRVIVPAREAFSTYYSENHYEYDKSSIPMVEGRDSSYPKNQKTSRDFFYKIPEQNDKWIAAYEKDGRGLIQFSSSILFGRKMFVWGMGRGGRHWNKWLTKDAGDYIEIQAGLRHTQLEHFIMDGNSSIEWIEGYALAKGDTEKIYSEDYDVAIAETQKCAESYFDFSKADDVMEELFGDLEFVEDAYKGSGWGAVENLARAERGDKPVSADIDFPMSSTGDKEECWITLLKEGYLPAPDSKLPPKSYMRDEYFEELLEGAIESGKSENWYSYYQLAIMKSVGGDDAAAIKLLEKSIGCEENAWAYNVWATLTDDADKAEECAWKALEINNSYRGLWTSFADILVKCEKYEAFLKMYTKLSDALRADSRVRMYKAICHINLDQIADAEAIINKDFVMYDLREGDVSTSKIWFDMYKRLLAKETGISDDAELARLVDEKYPLPAELDFRMK